MQELRGHPNAGEHVRVRGDSWLVVRTERFGRCTLVTLRGVAETNLGEALQVLSPFDRVQPFGAERQLVRASRHRVLRTAAHSIARAHRWGESWTAASARIDLLAWQLEPALAAVAGTTRLLLADAVGLGKTIQAALILTELRARGLVSRALIITPASLREQWSSELANHFDLNPIVFDHTSLAHLTAGLPLGVNPWSTAELIVSSIDLVKRPEVRVAVDAVPFDALVVDEAHHLTPGTDRGAVIREIASRTPWVVLATATPHSGDERAYAFLSGLGATSVDANLRIFRRSARERGRSCGRRVRLQAVKPTPAEQGLLDRSLAYARAIWRQRTDDETHARLVASVIARRAVSSALALERTLRRRQQLLSGVPSRPSQADLPWEETDAADAVEPDRILASTPLDDRYRELDWIDELLELANRASRVPSKPQRIRHLLARTADSVLIFSEYRDTVDDLRVRLEPVAALSVLHGGLSARARREAVHSFVSGRARVLLATDAAGEGLNLQARCRLVINTELPWNPLRLEQRIGRVDRIGQLRRVHVLHLFHRGSFEDTVLARLEWRMQHARLGDGARAPDQDAIAATVLGGQTLPESHEFTSTTSAERSVGPDATRMTTDRRMLSLLARSRSCGGFSPAPLCAIAPRKHLTRALILLFEATLHDANGCLAARELLSLLVRLRRPLRLHRRTVSQVLAALASAPDVRDRLRREMTARLEPATEEIRLAALAIEQRVQSISTRLSHQARARPFQASLFDRRAEQHARARDVVIASWQEHLDRRAEAARALSRVNCAWRPRLIAAWPVDAGDPAILPGTLPAGHPPGAASPLGTILE